MPRQQSCRLCRECAELDDPCTAFLARRDPLIAAPSLTPSDHLLTPMRGLDDPQGRYYRKADDGRLRERNAELRRIRSTQALEEREREW